MLDHLGLQAADVDVAVAFYLEAFAPLGFHEAMRIPTEDGPVVGLAGADGFPHFWLAPARQQPHRETHVAFTAASREVVDQVHEAARAAGAEILHPPRLWPEYHPNYYGVFLRDPDGNNVEAVHHG